MGRENTTFLWPARKRAMQVLKRAGVYGYINEAAVHARAAVKTPGAARARGTKGLPPTRFFIFAHGRSGSRLLCDLLHSHPDITCDLEILAERARSPRGIIEAHARMCPTVAHGFKVKIYQLTDAQGVTDVRGFIDELHDDGWKLIYLHRKNVVRHAISGIVREHTGQAHRIGAKEAAQKYPRIIIDPQNLEQRVRGIRETLETEEQTIAGLPFERVTYDDDLMTEEAQQRTGARLVEWLGLRAAPVRCDVKPSTPRKLVDLVENYDELVRAFEGTPEAQFLES